MVDIVSPEKRSRMMSGIRSKNTVPEMTVRKALHRNGYRYRLHSKKLPGHPDLVLSKYGAAIFVNGCFWHGHDCHLFKWPKTRPEFWKEKIGKNKSNDIKHQAALKAAHWRVMVIWECALKGKTRIDEDLIVKQIETWLHSNTSPAVISGL